MRQDDRGRWQTVYPESLSASPKSVERMEMVRDIDKALSLVSTEVSRICRLCADVADETGKVRWREVARRYGAPEEQWDHFMRPSSASMDVIWTVYGNWLVDI
jgi:hypothetical protein